VGTGGSFPGVKREKYEADSSPPSSAEVKNGGAVPPFLHTSLCGGAVKVAEENEAHVLSPVNFFLESYGFRNNYTEASVTIVSVCLHFQTGARGSVVG
jgi:hypothetical protein